LAAGTSGYDAFISYSHALDGKLAPTLQRELERFAKPWNRGRALRAAHRPFEGGRQVTVSPDGRFMASTDHAVVRLWTLPDLAPWRAFTLTEGEPLAIGFNGDIIAGQRSLAPTPISLSRKFS
jgi:hypothetical protein